MKNYSRLLLIAVILAWTHFTPQSASAQGVGINSSGNAPDASAGLDLSFPDKGVLIPRISLTSVSDETTIPSPASSLLVFNTNSSISGGSGEGFYYWDGSQWKPIAGAGSETPCSSAPSTPGTISGTSAVCTGNVGTFFVPEVSGATSYNWSYSGTGATISGSGNAVVISFSSSAISGNLTVTASNGCGTSSASSPMAITVNVSPNSAFTPSTLTPSFGQSVTFVPSEPDYQALFWTFPGFTSAASLPSFNWNTYGTVNVTLTATKNGCNTTSTVAVGNTAPASGPITFSFTGSPQAFVVPSGVSEITIDARGGQGYEVLGGKGGRAVGSLNVTPGQVLYVYVGQWGQSGGWNGGGGGGGYTGGGASDVRVGGFDLSNRIIVAGGGGGIGYAPPVNTPGGDGGANTGGSGTTTGSAQGGSGGTQSAGGAGGTGNDYTGASGTFGYGGARIGGNCGGGGGGYYGGGAGGATGSVGGAGGGGSNYLGGVTPITNSAGFQTGNGQIIFTY